MIINKKGVFVLLTISLFVIALSLSFGVVSAQEDTGTFSIFTNEDGGFRIFVSDKFGDSVTDIIVSIIMTLIIFAGLYDIIELVGIFQLQWVKYILAGGISLIGVLFGIPIKLTSWAAGALATFGAAAIFIEIGVVIALFIALSFGGSWAAKFAAKRKAQVAYIKATESAGSAAAAIHGLKEIEKEFKKK